ncbi:DNA polymerase I [Hoeflea sp. YIM 152468]|uniref:DNA polymerase I n=1 Tax=Hoeflea sp. YIM 152468 TaxID=3031759 RepID=UPI0023DC2E14|nr:DNA polymerase I [Hoeflea sp. YIM 152468]MDF1610433.1 DNA polymerase I [Hoeflea sp. YIM 152468]
MKKGDHLFLVDGSGYIFRAYHALPPLTRKSDGLPVGAVAGFCNMLWKLMSETRDTSVGVTPTHFAVIFDYSSKTFRNELYPDYKANRTAPPEDLVPQFAVIREATRAFDLPCIEMEGFEADDLIATYARLAREAGADVTVISSDKDLMQLVGPQVTMYDSMKDRQIAVQDVIDKWGVPPEKMIDLQALTGDSVDNVPGIPGIGPKTAALLISEFGDLDTLLARAGEIKQNKRRENIIEFADKARISRELVRLRDDIDITEKLDELVLNPLNGPKLVAFLKGMEFASLTRRVATATDTDASAVDAAEIAVDAAADMRGPDLDPGQAVSAGGSGTSAGTTEGSDTPQGLAKRRADAAASAGIDTSAYETLRELDQLRAWCAMARETGMVAIDTETTSLDAMQAELVGFSLAIPLTAPDTGELKVRACYAPLGHSNGVGDLLGGGGAQPGQMPMRAALDELKSLLEDPAVLKIGQNLKYDMLVLAQHGISIESFDDTMLLSYVLDAGQGGHGMDPLAERWLGHKTISYKDITGSGKSAIPFAEVDIDKATAYAAEDADVTLRLWHVLKPRLVSEGLAAVYERLERPLAPVLMRMENRGIRVDRQILSRLSGELAQGAAALEAEIQALAGENFNVGSPKQLGEILFDKMSLPGGSKTKTGQWSTSAQALEDLAAAGHELPRKIVDWRQLTKLKSTYTDALPGFINPQTQRVHTSFAMAATTTGRLSSSDPNIQNIPVRTAEGRKIRTAFIAEPGNVLISADYSQIELRVLAHVANIPQLTQAFSDGVDIHAMTASEMFGVPVDGMPPEVRRRAKAINFGIIYGISAFGLANQLSISRSEAGEYIRKYFERFPGIKDYMEATKAEAKEYGYVTTIFGRRAHYPEIRSSNPQVRAFNERAAINAPIQGSAADVIRRAMVRMEPALATAGVEARMLLQVHDELIFETAKEDAETIIPLIVSVMENAAMPAVDMAVPLEVDARAALNWDEAH